MYCGHARLCVCLSTAACLHYCTDPDVTWRCGRGCLCTIGRIRNRCTGCVARPIATLWKCVAEPSGNPPGPPHAARRTHYACRRRLPSPAIKSTRLLRARRYLQRRRSISTSILRGVVMRTRNVSEYMLVLALCLVVTVSWSYKAMKQGSALADKPRDALHHGERAANK